MTIDEQIAREPWMENFRKDMWEQCRDCGVAIGERHQEGCDVARCTTCGAQHIQCRCRGEPDCWTGLFMPEAHKICLDQDLWAHCLDEDGTPVDFSDATFLQMDGGVRVQWHVPCRRGDPHAYPNLNRAVQWEANHR